MKTTFVLFIGFFLLIASANVSGKEVTGNETQQKGAFSITCTPDLFNLTNQWANEYIRLNPKVNIKIIKKVGMNLVSGTGNLGFISGKPNLNTNWQMVVGRDIIVAVVNPANPLWKEINKQGLSPAMLAEILTNPEKRNWKELLSSAPNSPLQLYIVNDESLKSGLNKFLNTTQSQLTAITFGTSEEVISALSNDPNAIGFCKLVDIQKSDVTLNLLPIDKNGNGTIDYMEAIYSDLNTFQRGVWVGKYPKSLINNIYAVSAAQPTNEAVAFMKWVVTEGQQLLNTNGYCEMINTESQSQLDRLTISSINLTPAPETSNTSIILLLLAVVLGSGMIVSLLVRNFKKSKEIATTEEVNQSGFAEKSLALPKGLFFDKSHIWSFMEKDGNIAVGIDDFLQHVIGKVSRIEMKNPGDIIRKGDVLFSINQFGKQLKVYSPVSGCIVQQNDVLLNDTSALNSSPYENGWIYRIEPSNWLKELQLMDLSDKYRSWINAEFTRLKEFMAAILSPGSPELAHVILQDGGEIKEGILADFGPEVWEDFQTNFLDTFK